MSDDLPTVITIRMPVSLAQKIFSNVGKGKPYKDKSEACRTYMIRGLQFEELKKITNDPVKKKRFEELLKSVITEKHDRENFETMEVEDLENIIFLATQVKNKKMEQLMLNVD